MAILFGYCLAFRRMICPTSMTHVFNRMSKKATSGVLSRSALLTYYSTLRGLRSLGPCWMTFFSILLILTKNLCNQTLSR
jgi:hypothetical protein